MKTNIADLLNKWSLQLQCEKRVKEVQRNAKVVALKTKTEEEKVMLVRKKRS